MSLRESAPMTEEAARLLNPLQLAYMGDTVWDLLVRTRLLYCGKNLRHMHQEAVAHVNAAAQAKALCKLEGLTTDAEGDIIRRGRNAHARHPVPKNQDPADYSAATGLEALIGYLYVTGQEERLLHLFDISQQEDDSCRQS